MCGMCDCPHELVYSSIYCAYIYILIEMHTVLKSYLFCACRRCRRCCCSHCFNSAIAGCQWILSIFFFSILILAKYQRVLLKRKNFIQRWAFLLYVLYLYYYMVHIIWPYTANIVAKVIPNKRQKSTEWKKS